MQNEMWMSAALVNCQSVCNKAITIKDFVIDHDLELVLLTETWLTSSRQKICGDLTPTGYKLRAINRKGKRGGGVAVLYKANIKITEVKDVTTSSMEAMAFTISAQKTVRIVLLYRLIPSKSIPRAAFIPDLRETLETLAMGARPFVILGDFNIHWNAISDLERKSLSELCSELGLQQHVHFPTHEDGNTLDLIISRNVDNLIASVAQGSMLSDHYTVKFSLNVAKPHPPRCQVSFRKIRNLDHRAFGRDLEEAFDIDRYDGMSPEAMLNHYDAILKELLDRYAPQQTAVIAQKARAAWYSEEIAVAKRERRRLEGQWKRTKLTIHHEMFKRQRNAVTSLINKTRAKFYCGKVEECQGNQKALFKLVDKLLHRKDFGSCCIDAQEMSSFFENKIKSIWDNLQHDDTGAAPDEEPPQAPPTTEVFAPASEDEVSKIIKSMSSATCALDPLPTSLIKQHLLGLIPVITAIVNSSVQTGVFPDCLKQALVQPRLKKKGLDPDDPKSYRPISNLPFIGKVIERVVCARINAHMTDHRLYEDYQSAYRPLHSTETVLLSVQGDLLKALDQQNGVLMVLLDLTAAFDTVSHDALLAVLRQKIGFEGTALQWIKSYLTGRSQTVHVGTTKSDPSLITCGVPQGSVLGPLLFSIYMLPVGEIVRNHGLNVHMYADDSQLYVSFGQHEDPSTVCSKVESCITELKMWMTRHFLQLNDAKTEVVCFASKRSGIDPDSYKVKVGTSEIQPSSTAKNLGVVFDQHLTMENFIASTCQSCYFHLKDIAAIRDSLTNAAASQLVHSLVTSRLDYCNSLLVGCSQQSLSKLQRVQNMAARIVAGRRSRHFDSSRALLKHLHWLPIQQRIEYKVLLMAFKSQNELAPPYLSRQINSYEAIRPLRSEDQLQLALPDARPRTRYGDRKFCEAAPRLWNRTDRGTRQAETVNLFKSKLKTELFTKTFI